eukprot:15202163-Alexandrium_andersonii.AAC.1
MEEPVPPVLGRSVYGCPPHRRVRSKQLSVELGQKPAATSSKHQPVPIKSARGWKGARPLQFLKEVVSEAP